MENHIEQQSGNEDRELGVCEALHNAAAEGDRATIHKLLTEGVGVNIANESGETAFSYACVNNQFETAVMLYERGADIHALDKDGASAIDWAKTHASDAFYAWLLEIGCEHKLDGPPRVIE
jgi:ankyrin repeat protein